MTRPVFATKRRPAAGAATGRLRGFGNLWRQEAAAWTRTRARWLQPLLWVGLLNGLMTFPLVFMRDLFASEFGGPAVAATDMFFSLAALATAAGAILLAHGAILGERQQGTAAWVLSKPVARTAFVLAKFAALSVGLLLTAVTLPAAIAYALLSFEGGAPLAVGRFAAAAGILALSLTWYLALTVMLGTLLDARAAVLAIPLASLVGGDVLIAAWGGFGMLGPWVLGRAASLLAQGGPLLSAWPLVATAVGAVSFVGVALWRFERQEL